MRLRLTGRHSCFHTIEQGLRGHQHAAAAAKGVIIGMPVLVLGIVPDIVHGNLQNAVLDGPPDEQLSLFTTLRIISGNKVSTLILMDRHLKKRLPQ